MRHLTKIALVALLLGAVLVTAAFAAVGFDVERLGTQMNDEEKIYTTGAEQLRRIEIDEQENAVRVVPATDGRVTLTYYENERRHYEIKEQGGTLSVVRKSETFFSFFDFHFKNREICIAIPPEYAGALSVDTASGAIEVERLTFDARLESASGGISVGDGAGDLQVETVSGNIHLGTIEAGSLSAVSTSGGVSLAGATVMGNAALRSVSGGITVGRIDAGTLSAQTTSGKIDLAQVATTGDMVVSSVSGGVHLQVRGAYLVDAHSVSGSVSAMESTPDAQRKMTVTTTSGSIKIARGE